MNEFTARKVAELVLLYPDVVSFGTEADQVGDYWICKAEQVLGLDLSASYKWFLKTYVGGEIGSEEIYSIYGVDFESVNGGDIVYQHLMGKKIIW
ncbi:SMI1/KNR4 family protein [Pseudomonas wadenswilerensis]